MCLLHLRHDSSALCSHFSQRHHEGFVQQWDGGRWSSDQSHGEALLCADASQHWGFLVQPGTEELSPFLNVLYAALIRHQSKSIDVSQTQKNCCLRDPFPITELAADL